MFIDVSDRVWAADDQKHLWVFHPLTLAVKSKINLKPLFNFKDKVSIELFHWHRGRFIVFDRISGIGFVFYQFKPLLRFKEFLGT